MTQRTDVTNTQIEAWVLDLVDSIGRRQPPEDSRVELKAEWPEPQRAARRIAGHANAAQGDDILWVIGLDEVKGVVEFAPRDVAEWFPQVTSEFDGISPDLRDLVIPTPHGPVVALLLDTSRAPYVVRNPSFGRVKGEAIEWEVPWRDGTRIRSATRGDLIRLLAPALAVPEVEVLNASLDLFDKPAQESGLGEPLHEGERQPHLRWELSLRLYITPRTPELVVLPVHRTSLGFRVEGTHKELIDFSYSVPYVHHGSGLRADSHTVIRTNSEAIIDGPGVLTARGWFVEPHQDYSGITAAELLMTARPAAAGAAIQVTELLQRDEARKQQFLVASWTYRGHDGT
jgi:hypothetical protein